MTNISSGDGTQAASLGLWQDAHLNARNISADYNMLHSQAGARSTGARSTVDTNNNTDDEGSLCAPATSTTTSPKTSASFVSSSLTSRVSFLSLSEKSTVDVVGNIDYATGSFCSSCYIPPPPTGGLWSAGVGCAMCSYDRDDGG